MEKHEFSRKVFGARELKIIEKQLRGISLTQSEKNRLSRDIRTKFEFIKDCAIFSKEFKLKKGYLNKKLIEETKEIILGDKLAKNIDKIFLFGSILENKLTIRSDIDIAVKFKKINLREATLFRVRVSGRIDKKLDIQVYNVLPEKIKREIEKKHKVLYEDQRKNKRNRKLS